MTTATTQSAPNGADLVTSLCDAMRRAAIGYGGLTRLAHRSAIPTQTLKRYRDGEREPRLSELMRLSDADADIQDALVCRILRISPQQRADLMRVIKARQ